ncbi:transcriptional regulator GcvA [candidate division GN15 bacterium]|nr:transcriptional regulator GcvA [candidate division GN15 bacterium]
MISGRVLPSLTALEYFDAAARHVSFTQAARELNITQSAVSRQIQRLEEFVGRPLFHRHKQRLVLTEAGKSYASSVRELINRAEAATLQVMAYGSGGGTLTVALLPTFGSRWLVPRLADFTARYPDIHLNLVTQVRPFDFEGSDVDVAIHFGRDIWPGATCHRLMGETVMPVAAPQLLAARSGLSRPEDVGRYTLLQHVTRPNAWPEWLKEAGVHRVDGRLGPRFEQIQMVIQAATAGLGLALLPRFLIREELSGDRLKVAIDLPVTSERAYYLVHPESKADLSGVIAFKTWLLEKCNALEADA